MAKGHGSDLVSTGRRYGADRDVGSPGISSLVISNPLSAVGLGCMACYATSSGACVCVS